VAQAFLPVVVVTKQQLDPTGTSARATGAQSEGVADASCEGYVVFLAAGGGIAQVEIG
jgi:hypothetical protein